MWPLVALVGMLLAAAVAIVLFIPEDNANAGRLLVILSTALSALLASLYVKVGVDKKVDQATQDRRDDADDPDSTDDER
jgi:hypothetical protein